jgi:type IV pilus assembly protein PilY1
MRPLPQVSRPGALPPAGRARRWRWAGRPASHLTALLVGLLATSATPGDDLGLPPVEPARPACTVTATPTSPGLVGPPAMPINAYRRGSWRDDAFLGLFQNRAGQPAAGNLKRYRLVGGELHGRDGPATDPATGRLRGDAWSFWSAERDGDQVRAGGAASRLPAWADRRLHTDIAGPDLAAASNAVTAANAALTTDLLDVVAEDRTTLLEWARGRDALDADGDGDTAETRRELGAAPRATPVILDYGSGSMVVFLPTHEGYLHAFDAATGEELWAFLPKRLLARLGARFRNDPAASQPGGLDGGLTLHVVDRDGQPGVGAGDQALLLFGMGRGGSAVFSLDVSDRLNPRLLWQHDPSTPGFRDLGQTWSPPVVARVRVRGRSGPEEVAIFAGGYDPLQDAGGAGADTVGNGLYVVDLQSGSLLWSAGHPGAAEAPTLALPSMVHSLVAAPRVVDLDGDGLADRLYVGDLGGRLWRFDIVNGESPAALVEGGVLASLGASGPASASVPTDARRFGVTPDVVPLLHFGQLLLAVNLGSGHPGRPFDTATAEAFYSIRDPAAGRRLTRDYASPLTIADLTDVTTDLAPRLSRDLRGWQLRLTRAPGEKVLGSSVTIRNELFFTSFTPAPGNDCLAGSSRLYRVSVRDGRPWLPAEQTPRDPRPEDRSTELGPGPPGLAPVAVLHKPEVADHNPAAVLQVCVGVQCSDRPARSGPEPTYWYPDPSPAGP